MATGTNETDADVRVAVSQLTQTMNLALCVAYDCPVGDGIFCDITTLRVGLDARLKAHFLTSSFVAFLRGASILIHSRYFNSASSCFIILKKDLGISLSATLDL